MIKVSKKIYMKVIAIFMLIAVGVAQIGDMLTQSLYASEKTMAFSYTGGVEKVFTNKDYDYNTSYRKAKLDDYTAYCLDYGRQLPAGTLKYKRELSDAATSILVKGYPNTTASEIGASNEKEAYLATQLALWNTVKSTGDSKTGLAIDFNSLKAVSGEEALFEKVKKLAIQIIARAKADPYNPSFSLKITTSKAKTTNNNGDVVIGPYVLAMTGFNGKAAKLSLSNAPSSAKITDKNGSSKTSFTAGEEIYVTMDGSEKSSTLKLNATVSGYEYVGAVYGSSDSAEQNYVTAVKKTVSEEATASVSWTNEPGKIQIIKVDSNGNRLTGAKFSIKNSSGKEVAQATTNANGTSLIDGLPVGDYTVVETYAPSGYVLNNTPAKVSVKSGTTVSQTFINQKESQKSGNIQIIKVDQYNNKITGAKFELRNSSNNLIAEGTTNTSGTTTFSGLPVGNYIVIETYTPSNYILNSNPMSITVSSGNTETRTVVNYIKTVDRPVEVISGAFKITKVDESGSPIANVKFDLFNASRVKVAIMTTNTSGVSIASGLPAGTYYYRETEVPAGVIIDNNEYSFTISSSTTVERTIVNKLQKGTLKIVKVDESGKSITNVKFNILNSSRNVIATMTTDTSGVTTISDLPNGTYYYQEISAPENVIIDNNQYQFTIDNSTKYVEKRIVNSLKGSIKIVKVDENGNYLANVKFNILDSAKNKIATITTDNNGIATLVNLTNGTYYYQEVSAPENVVLDTTQYEFAINSTSKSIEKRVVNNLIKGNLKIVKVDDLGNKLSGVKFEILDLNMNVLDTIVTGQDGTATSKSLPKGKYYYREVEAPSNLIFDKQVYAFTISKTGEVITKEIVNETIKGSLQIVKKDDEQNPLQGVKFNILDSNKKVVETITTDKNGIANTSNLPMGKKYYYKEVKVPDNVIIDSKEYEFTIENGIIQKNVVNFLKRAKLQIIKLDKNNKEPISNVKFDILNENKQVVETITTDSQGNAYSKELPLGKYYYKEVSVPNEYKIDTKEYDFSIKDNDKDIQKVVYNTKKESLPATGSAFGANIGIIFVVAGASIIGYVLVASSKSKKKFYR